MRRTWRWAVWLLGLLWLLPILWVVLISLKPNADLRRGGTAMLAPYPLTFENYLTLARVSHTPRWLLNSFLVSGSVTMLTLVLCALAGYALARIPFRGKTVVFALLVAGMMIPGQAVIVPLHALFASWNLHNTYSALILPRLAAPFGALLMMQTFKGVPRDIEEAAELDHAGRLKIFVRILLPMAVPALTSLGVFTFLATWNDFFWPLVSATDPEMHTVTVGLASLQGNFAQSEGLGFLLATGVFAGLPMVLVYLLFQHHIVSGVAAGSVSGPRHAERNGT